MKQLPGWLAALVVSGAAIAAGPFQQDTAATDDDAVDTSRLEAYLDKALHGSAVIRPQAAARLVPMGKVAADRILAVAGAGPERAANPVDAAQLGSALVEVLGAFQDERLRELLWRCIDDRDFPWRPAAARSLAANPLVDGRETETRAFHGLLSDPIAPVRMAAVQAFPRLHPEPLPRMRVELRVCLADPSDFVRRAAAEALAGWGEPEALLWLVEDLRRTDTFFERWSGKNAAYESRRALARLLGDTYGFDPEAPPSHPANAVALEQIEAAVRARIGDRPVPKLPAVARASAPIEGAVLGLELISCRRGEHYLCWTTGDELLVGMGNPARVALPKGTVARLTAAAQAAAQKIERPYYGEPGCDLEMLRFVETPGTPTRSWIVSKGQASVDGLRPAALGELMRTLLDSIPAQIDSDDPRLTDLRNAALETMAAIGGP